MEDRTLGYPLFRDSTPQTNFVTLSFLCAVSETARSKEERGSESYPASQISQPIARPQFIAQNNQLQGRLEKTGHCVHTGWPKDPVFFFFLSFSELL